MRRVLLALVVLSALIGAAWYGLHFVPVDATYVVEADFADLPPNDDALNEWLGRQPGVWRGWCERRPAGERTRLVVTVGMTRDGWGRPPLPDLDGRCAELGYRGQDGPFRDTPDRYR